MTSSASTESYVRPDVHGVYRVGTSRVSLDSVVHAYGEGESPEAIVEEFSTLTAEQVYGAIAFYLRDKVEIDQHFSQQAARWEELQRSSDAQHGPLLDRLRAQRKPDTGAQHAS